MAHDVRAVANKFLERAFRAERTVTPMQLQKYCFMAHGYSMALDWDPLINSSPQAWDWGPVYPDLYSALRRYGSRPIPELIHENNWAAMPHIRGDIVREPMAPSEDDLISVVYDTYGEYEAFRLSAFTHADGSPWSQIYRPGVKGLEIPNELIRDYYRGLISEVA